MTRDEIIIAACKRSSVEQNISNVLAKQIGRAIFDEIADALKRGEDVTIASFGKFYVKMLPDANRRNPQTGEIIKVPSHRAPRFSYSGVLKKSV